MAQYTKYHQLLGVHPDDSKEDIKKAYRKLALKYHPDVNSTADAHQKFLEITTAYEVLTGQRKIKSTRAYTPKTKEEILEEKIRVAKARYEKMMAEEKRKDQDYYGKIAFGWKWNLFRVGAVYGIILTVLLCIDVYSVGERKAIPPTDIWYNPLNRTIFIKSENERFDIPDNEFWFGERLSVRGNYSMLFNDLKSITVVIAPIEGFERNRHSFRMRELTDFDDYKVATYTSTSSIYSVFPIVHFFLIVPFILVVFKRPNLRFSVWRLVSIWIIYPTLIFLTFSSNRIFELFGY